MSAIIKFQDVEKYYGDFHALHDINLKINAGETVVLIGPSGSGKSTLLRTINGLEDIQKGKLVVDGMDISSKDTNVNKLRTDVGMVFQHFNLYNNKTILENIMLAPQIVLKRPKDKNREIADELLAKVDLSNQGGKYPAQLSGGQKQRIAIARSLAMDPRVLLFDEPTSALDPEMVGSVLNVMRDIAMNSDMTTLVVTHEMDFAKAVADRVIFMADGKILEDSSTDEFFKRPKTERARQFLSQVEHH
ncbi:amino acid ABC transporter ATP-binding protein [Fructilactobacillus lindneri]|uniref:Glutamine transport ATP-binding protein glnQ n=2 Tax=Fructilactobacillus lindneri TaxID=53444 RepID=A0A0R2JLZ9_9LACO|nr:amino acid ABC transporter ATP-binding protein [Fructilactobacillus lindneri]ANZ57572.1 amino acid ABC transporter ATP-binding protein [Fructilactobacillus lindneri]ANZ58841.1 amino acid ABC transporter ATP-binding protein [Fructilactobacillus lindneri]KRN78238.1 glutamine transport ATP-binding protein glnQ [Fructilactobacillus lindneri DSM 20690 = JCM 11027]POG97724.1 amino acid ABC transporter ATP-binding protein [Fructilactobacillus lindneri]POH00052.1 amino acid ABC transporter ATP-bind